MRKQLERRANMIFGLAAVAIIAVLLLSDTSSWIVLVPVWFVSWVVTQVALQHYATYQKNVDYDRENFGAVYISELFKNNNSTNEMNDNGIISRSKSKITGSVK